MYMLESRLCTFQSTMFVVLSTNCTAQAPVTPCGALCAKLVQEARAGGVLYNVITVTATVLEQGQNPSKGSAPANALQLPRVEQNRCL